MADASSSRHKIQRTSKPKVRSGCITCKQRRVKCDETKPECIRCQNFGCVCDGYEFPTRLVPQKVQRRFLVPKGQAALQIVPQKSSNGIWLDPKATCITEGISYNTSYIGDRIPHLLDLSSTLFQNDQLCPNILAKKLATPTLIHSPQPTIFESEMEAQYFRYYCDTTAQQLSGGFGDGTWNYAFLQASHEEPFIRRAIIAIAALSKTMEVTQPGIRDVRALPDIKDALTHNPHHVFALQQYGKAIRQMREAITKGEENIRIALISCLLTVCFESFHGNHENALNQIGVGLRIMEDWLKKQHVAKNMEGLESPNPHVVDNRLFHCFMRLDVAAMHFFDQRSGEFHREQSLQGLETIKHMPESFGSLEDAGVYFSVVMKRIIHFVKWIESKGMRHRHHKEARMGTTGMETTFPHRHQNIVLGHTLLEVADYSAELERWAAAFQPIMDRSRTLEKQLERLPAAFLKVHQKLLVVLLGGLKCDEECLFDQFLPEFTEIVILAETLLTHPYLAHSARKAVFVFDPNIILPLLVVAIKCRNGVIRRKAIELLQANPRREGTWDSSLAAGIGLWHMALEEEGLQTGEFVPEKNRVRMAGVKQDFDKRTANLSASQEINGETVIHETIINW